MKKRRHQTAPKPSLVMKPWEEALREYQIGRLDQALGHVRRILALDPSHADSLHLAGVIVYQHGKLSLAIARIRRAIRIRGDAASYHSHLGIALSDAGQLGESVTAYRRAISLAPGHAGAQSNLANALHNSGSLHDAETACRRALRLQGAFAEAFCNLANILNGLDRSAEALAASRHALVLKPDYPEVLSNAGNALKQMRRYDEAEASYRRSILLKQDFPDALANLAGLLRSLGRYAAAAAASRQAVSLKPVFPEAYANIGSILVDVGRYEQALAVQSVFLSRLIAVHSLRRLVADGRLNVHGKILASNILLCHWLLDHDPQSVEAVMLAPFTQVAGQGGRENPGAYFRYVASLYEHRRTHPEIYRGGREPSLHVIGESHSLAPANARFSWHGEDRRATTVFVMGFKMFHLAPGQMDYHRPLLESRLAVLPPAATVLFTIGEIDCRPNEGIWHAHKKKRLAWDRLAEETVAGYLHGLETALSGLALRSVTLQGIPAPAYSLDSLAEAEDRKLFLAMIRLVNRLLREGASARCWSFLDVHAATADGEGVSNRLWHLDAYHLSPQFYTDAAVRYLITPDGSI